MLLSNTKHIAANTRTISLNLERCKALYFIQTVWLSIDTSGFHLYSFKKASEKSLIANDCCLLKDAATYHWDMKVNIKKETR